MIHAKELPRNLWAEAVNTTVYLLNTLVEREFQELAATRHHMNYSAEQNQIWIMCGYIRSEAFVHIPKQFTRKFDARSKKILLVGKKF